MRRKIITITILILGIAIAVQDEGTTRVLNPQFNGTDLSIPKSINFQGYLYRDGTPMDTIMNMWFGIYDSPGGGSQLFQQTINNVTVTKGWFTVSLDNIPNSVFPVGGPTRYLEVKAPSTGPALSPRISLVSVGYSYHALTADTAEYAKSAPLVRPITPPIYGDEIRDTTITTSKIKDGAITSSKILDGTIRGIDIAKPCTLSGSVAFPDGILCIRNNDPNGTGLIVDRAGWYGIFVDSVVDYGVWVNQAGMNGVCVNRAASNAIWLQRAGLYGIRIDSAGNDGVYLGRAGDDGIWISRAGSDGVQIDSAAYYGIRILRTGYDGVWVSRAGDDGVSVDSAGRNGVYVNRAAEDGFRVYRAGRYGVLVDSAGSYGAYISRSGSDGIYISRATDDGVQIYRCGDNGIQVDSAGDIGVYVVRCDTGMKVDRGNTYGVRVDSAGTSAFSVNYGNVQGVWVANAGTYGVRVANAGDYGVYSSCSDGRGGYFSNSNNDYYPLTAWNTTGTGAAIKGLYVRGNGYATGGWSTFLADGKSGFSLTSTDMDIVARGSASLTDGRAMITFDKTYEKAFSNDVPLTVIVTPTSECNGILVIDKSASGFTAKELLNGKSNATFDWIAIGRIKGYEQRPGIRPITAEQIKQDEQGRLTSEDGITKLEESLRISPIESEAETQNQEMPSENR